MRSYYRYSYGSVVQPCTYARGLTMNDRSARVCAEGFNTEVITDSINGQGPHLDRIADDKNRNSRMIP